MGFVALGVAATVAGLGAGIYGTSRKASEASKARKALEAQKSMWLPDIPKYEKDYFDDLGRYQGRANQLAAAQGKADLDNALALREQALPGSVEGTRKAFNAALPLAEGELPDWLKKSFAMGAGADAFGSGFGGTPFGKGLAGWGSVDRALGAQRQGVSLLQALLGTMPQLQTPTGMTFLSNLLTPSQRTTTQLQVRNQNLGIAGQVAGMPTGNAVWGDFAQQTGGQLFGAGVGALTGGMGGMGGGSSGTQKVSGDTLQAAGAYNQTAARNQAAGIWGIQ